MNPNRCLAALLACAAIFPAQAQDSAALAARVNGQPLYAFTLDAMQRSAPQQQSRPTADTLVADRLLASWVRTRFSAQELYPATAIGFARDVALDDALVAALRGMHAKELEAELRALPGASLTGLILDTYPVDAGALERLFGKSDTLRLDYTVNPEQAASAKQVSLMRFKIGAAAPATLTIYDLLRRQNVQGRMEFFNRNVEFMREQARARVAQLFVLDWATRRFGAGPLADLRQALSDQDDVRAAMDLYGLAEAAESQSPMLAMLARQVTQAEVNAYYAAHKQLFRRIERVKARHIRVPDEALAKRVEAQAAAGSDFAQLARRYSLAPDADRGGDLGWVRQSADPDWLASLALFQEPGKVSNPFRAAVGADQAATWEIVLVEKRVEGYHPADSETVRYLARAAIARDKARAQFAAARAQTLRGAAIQIEPALQASRAAP